MNFKRHRCRRQVQCTYCTPHRWRGNHTGRFKAKDERGLIESQKCHRKGPMSTNQEHRSIEQKLKHRRKELDKWLDYKQSWFTEMAVKDLQNTIRKLESRLFELQVA